jgi:hypothetical protein
MLRPQAATAIQMGNDESAGKRRSNRVRKGGTWLKTTAYPGNGPPCSAMPFQVMRSMCGIQASS